MNREAMIAGLRDEIERLTQAMELLEQGGEATGAPSSPTPDKKLPTTNSRRGKRSPEARARMALAQQKRHKARRAAAKKAGSAR